MSSKPDWLPPLVFLKEFGGDWEQYLEAIYQFFKQDFIDSKPVFQGKRLSLKRHPVNYGKEATFWHITSKGEDEESRTTDIRRCERICWPKPVIENSDDQVVKYWTAKKRGENRVHIWLESEDYVVVLADRKGYLLLWTAFLITRSHTRAKLRKEHARFWRNKP